MIYVIPSPLVDNEEINFKEKSKGFVEIAAPNFWYLHGDIESKFHYDKAYMFIDYGTSKTEFMQTINNRTYLAPGIYDVVVEGYNKPCRGYFWHAKESEHILLRGLVVDTTNKDDIKYAIKMFNKKPLIL